MKNGELSFIKCRAYHLRRLSILSTTYAGSGHPTSCLSAADIVSVLFFKAMRYDPCDIKNPDNDRFILSKGHAAPLLYSAWQQVGVLEEDDLKKLRTFDSVLEGHPTGRFEYAEVATGSLGCGLSIGVGMALAAKQDKKKYRTYVLLGDGEIAEGSVWEAAELASYYNLSNLIGIVDCSRLGQSDATLHGHSVKRHKEKFEAFGWNCAIVDGHNISELVDVFEVAHKSTKPFMVIAKTIKGYGVHHVENKVGFHGKAFSKDQLDLLLDELKQRFKDESCADILSPLVQKKDIVKVKDKSEKTYSVPLLNLKKDELISTRKAYGKALVAAGNNCEELVVLDAEVKNSTYSQLFEEEYPKRFYQCFIAEQNMVGMAIGLSARGKIPFASTFAAFFSRAFDQIRMTPIGGQAIRLAGSHAGVSIGYDGPSQMGLEDLAIFRTLPNSVVLYPSDAVSAHKLVEQMLNYNNGISYMRTTRMATPVVYDSKETFVVGGCKVVVQSKDDVACVVGAGATLHEALKAAKLLEQDKIKVSVIDLYSVKPFDKKTVEMVAKKSGSKIITVEDHYSAGGIGEMISASFCNSGFEITNLSVEKLPRSGSPEKLLSFCEIDAAAIVRAVKKLI